MSGKRPGKLGRQWVSGMLIIALLCHFVGCADNNPPPSDQALNSFLNDTSGPPEPRASDRAMRMKADVIALPTISVAVWAIGALIVYIGTQEVFKNTIADFENVLGVALGTDADWSWAEEIGEADEQADHLTTSLNRVAYRSEGSDFYAVTGNDYLHFLNMISAIQSLDPKKLRDLLDGKAQPWGQYAKDFFKAIQVASVRARHLAVGGDTGRGLCARATVHNKAAPPVPYVGMARATGAGDAIPALVLASLKATIRCGMYDSDVREIVYGYFDVNGPLGAIPDIFISHMLKTAKLLYKYADQCQLPPTIVVDIDGGDCHDVGWD